MKKTGLNIWVPICSFGVIVVSLTFSKYYPTTNPAIILPICFGLMVSTFLLVGWVGVWLCLKKAKMTYKEWMNKPSEKLYD